MEDNKYLNEQKYQEGNKKIKKIGKILLIIGIIILIGSFIMMIVYFSRFGNTIVSGIRSNGDVNNTQMAKSIFGSLGLFVLGIFMNMIGFGLTVGGGILLFISHRREITAYTTQQVMPVAKEGLNEISPEIGNVAKEVTKGIKEGLKDEK